VPMKPTAEEDELAALQAEMALWAGSISHPPHYYLLDECLNLFWLD
jgi:hypothetical protein